MDFLEFLNSLKEQGKISDEEFNQAKELSEKKIKDRVDRLNKKYEDYDNLKEQVNGKQTELDEITKKYTELESQHSSISNELTTFKANARNQDIDSKIKVKIVERMKGNELDPIYLEKINNSIDRNLEGEALDNAINENVNSVADTWFKHHPISIGGGSNPAGNVKTNFAQMSDEEIKAQAAALYS
ncbi:hypothetical protein [Paenibacillus contaminans]|uniref:Uncharacterized protein n=1 Tax=Paenibacillus contaminans TaxID=450362 RepID=A0A329MRS2_9BACL|nr:hypothetical protein [Paenibacillus contaminans]RAV22671.1 hypothetical protein DQG23_00170 [Paenibacillus contaminans]